MAAYFSSASAALWGTKCRSGFFVFRVCDSSVQTSEGVAGEGVACAGVRVCPIQSKCPGFPPSVVHLCSVSKGLLC